MNHILDIISSFLLSAQGASATIAIVLEFALRMIPSKQPLSIAHLVASAMVKIGDLVSAIGKFLDKVLPQELIK